MINAGIYAIEPSVLDAISSGRKVSLEREIFPILAKRGKLFGFPFHGLWFDIGDLTDYHRANLTLLQKLGSKFPHAHPSKTPVSRTKVLRPTLVGERSKVSRSAVVGPNALVGKRCIIEKQARIVDSILFDSVSVGAESKVIGAIVASNVSIGKRVKIEPRATISPHVQIHDGVRIGRNAIIHPYKEITENVRAGANIM
jgi:mannose-1-phosphate guanylyltransferase